MAVYSVTDLRSLRAYIAFCKERDPGLVAVHLPESVFSRVWWQLSERNTKGVYMVDGVKIYWKIKGK